METAIYLLGLLVLIGALWWDKRPSVVRKRNAESIRRGYGFLLDKEEYNDAVGEVAEIHRPMQKPKKPKRR